MLTLFAVFFGLILIGVPVAVSIGLSALTTLLVNDFPIIVVAQKMVTGIDSFTFVAIPLFILAGELMNVGQITDRIFFVWITFLGLVFINGEERLIRFELLENKLPKVARAVLHTVQRLAALVLYAVMVIAGIQVIPFAQPQIFPTMPVSLVWLYLPVVIAGVLLIVQTLATLLLSFKGDSAGKGTPC